MKKINLKSSVNWCNHELSSLQPVLPHPDEEWYKVTSNYPIKIIRDEKTKLPASVCLHCGPVLTINEEGPEEGMYLKEICPCNNSAGDLKYYVLIYDISSNKETGVI